ncbi:hypothetical protein [Deinococcus humi]|uniref:hypothetical protein n=1 Tax=Deinococcus humi TaxID=662880 RepID=UPI003CC829F6
MTRRAGVAPNAAYRHFEDRAALLATVCAAAQAEVALNIEAQLAQLEVTADQSPMPEPASGQSVWVTYLVPRLNPACFASHLACLATRTGP